MQASYLTIFQTMRYLPAHRGATIPALLIITFLATAGGVTWLNSGDLFSTPYDAVGRDRAHLVQEMGEPICTARSWAPEIRESIRTGGLRMNHTQATFTALKPARGIGSTPNDRILIWTTDKNFTRYAEEVTRGRLSKRDMPTGIAIDLPETVWIAHLDHTNTVISLQETRPSFVVVHPD